MTALPRVKVVWTQPADQFVISGGWTIIEYKKSADSTWLEWSKLAGDKTVDYITDLKVGESIDVRLLHINRQGTPGAYCTPASITAASGDLINSTPGTNLVPDPDFSLGGTGEWDASSGWWTFANNFGETSWGARCTGSPTQMVSRRPFRAAAGERYNIRAHIYGAGCYARITFFDVAGTEIGYVTTPVRGAASWGFVEALGSAPVGTIAGHAEVLPSATNDAADSVKVSLIPSGVTYSDPATTVPPVLQDYDYGTSMMTLRNDDVAATIHYAVNGGGVGTYSSPFSASPGDVISAYATRSGYAQSPDSRLQLP